MCYARVHHPKIVRKGYKMGILDDLFGKAYAIDKVPSPKEIMDHALAHDTRSNNEVQYIEYPIDTSQ